MSQWINYVNFSFFSDFVALFLQYLTGWTTYSKQYKFARNWNKESVPRRMLLDPFVLWQGEETTVSILPMRSTQNSQIILQHTVHKEEKCQSSDSLVVWQVNDAFLQKSKFFFRWWWWSNTDSSLIAPDLYMLLFGILLILTVKMLWWLNEK